MVNKGGHQRRASTMVWASTLMDLRALRASPEPSMRTSYWFFTAMQICSTSKESRSRSPPNSGISSRINSGSKSLSHSSTIICFRSEEHTSELQSRGHLVCRLLLEKKKLVSGLIGEVGGGT